MKIFLTGSEGKIGKHFSEELRTRGIDFVGFDKVTGQDLLDPSMIACAMLGCSAVLHLAAASDYTDRGISNQLGENLQGLFNLLSVAEANAIDRFVYMSSVDALGIFKGESSPRYFPIDDNHPSLPSTEYGIGKLLAEQMCQAWSLRTGIPSIALRPPGVWFADTYDLIAQMRRDREEYEWNPYWEYGAFIDVRDLFEVSLKSLQGRKSKKFSRYLVSSIDITTSGRGSLELARMIHPEVIWKSTKKYESHEYLSILDCSEAMRNLDWQPIHSWEDYRAITRNSKI